MTEVSENDLRAVLLLQQTRTNQTQPTLADLLNWDKLEDPA
jgi:hypothetical protein